MPEKEKLNLENTLSIEERRLQEMDERKMEDYTGAIRPEHIMPKTTETRAEFVKRDIDHGEAINEDILRTIEKTKAIIQKIIDKGKKS